MITHNKKTNKNGCDFTAMADGKKEDRNNTFFQWSQIYPNQGNEKITFYVNFCLQLGLNS